MGSRTAERITTAAAVSCRPCHSKTDFDHKEGVQVKFQVQDATGTPKFRIYDVVIVGFLG